MEITKDTSELVYELEYIIGNMFYNPNSCNGYTGEEGLDYRYPVWICKDKDKDYESQKFYGKVHDIDGKNITTMKYKLGTNILFIGTAILDILDELEERYNIDFNKLEEEYRKKNPTNKPTEQQ